MDVVPVADDDGPSPTAADSGHTTTPAEAVTRGVIAAVAAFLVAVPFTLLFLLVTSESERVERLDRTVADLLHDWVLTSPGAGQVLVWISRATDPWLLRVAALALAGALAWRGRRRAGLWLTIVVVLGGLVGVSLKELVRRARPDFPEQVYVATGYSFPSGHALNSMLIALAVIAVLWPVASRLGRVVMVGGLTGLVLFVGVDRIALGVHYVTDVVAGWTIALAVVVAAAAAFLRPDDLAAVRRRPGATRPSSWPRALGRMLARLAAGWLAIVTIMVALGLLVTRIAVGRWPLDREDAVNSSLERGRTPTGETVTLVMSHLAATPVIIVTMVVVALVLRRTLGRWREGLFVIAATAGQAITFVSTAAFVARDRPDVDRLDASPPTSSFPSGHTSAALALYLSLATVLIRTVRRPWLRYVLAALCLIPPVLVAYSRLYRGMHHPSDVAGSLVNAGLCLLLAARVVLTGPLPEDPVDGSRVADDHDRESIQRSAPEGTGPIGAQADPIGARR
jgi:undecaprenyl-diphosphatase